MNEKRPTNADQQDSLGRRELLAYTAALGSTILASQTLAHGAEVARTKPRPRPDRTAGRYDMKKSINMWAFPYPAQWSLKECLQLAKDAGFNGVELNYDLQGDLSPDSSPEDIQRIRAMADEIQIQISGVCSFLYWPYSLTHNDPAVREKGIQLALQMIQAARLLGTDNLLVVPGAVYAAWVKDVQPVPNDVCEQRAKEAIRRLLPPAEKAGVYLNVENIFVSGFLFSPQEMAAFVDSFDSPQVRIHFDTGNIMQYQFPEHWIPILGKRIKNIHFKEWDKRMQEFNLNTFRTLLDGTTNWPAVMEALDKIEYRGYLTFEYFHSFQHFPEALVYQTSDALDWMLGRRA